METSPDRAATIQALQDQVNALEPHIEEAADAMESARERLSELMDQQRELNRQILAALKESRGVIDSQAAR